MGKTYYKNQKRFEEEQSSGRSGKHSKHSNNRKTGGMKTLNSYADDNYFEEDDENFDMFDAFDDEIEIDDNINIQRNK